MKNLAQFKKFVKPGQKWHCFHYGMNKDMGVREVNRVQSNAVTFKTERGESWLYFPKAVDFVSTGPDSFELFEGKQKLLSYKLVEAENLVTHERL